MKKVLSLFALLLIIPTFVFAESTDIYYTNANGVGMTYEEYQNLKNLGFEDFEIKYMSLEDFEENKNVEGGVVATSDKYLKTVGNPLDGYQTYEVTEDEYENGLENEVMPLTSVYTETTYKKMTTSIVKYGSYYLFANLLQWKLIPSTRSYDISGIGFQSTVTQAESIPDFIQYISYTDGTETTDTSYSYKTLTYGSGVSFKIPSGSNVVSLQSKLSFLVRKVTTETNFDLMATGDYSHATSNISSTNAKNYNVNIGGIILDSSISSYYDTIMANNLGINVTW